MPVTPISVGLTSQSYWSSLRSLFADPTDHAISDAGAAGELLVARVRFWASLALLTVPVASLIGSAPRPENRSSFFAVLVSSVAALVFLLVVRGGARPRGIGLFSSLFDVTLVSATQVIYLLQALPSVAVNSRTTFLAYFIAIGATCLRWDPRICLAAGALATAQYTGIVIAAARTWPSVRTDDVMVFGEILFGQQVGRLLMLVIFTLLCTTIIHRSLKLRILSTQDGLTGLVNRSYFEERVSEELGRAYRNNTSLCVAVLDLDHFKSINDRFGHEVGDAALKVVAKSLKESLRRSDLVARWGGEEFAIAFPDAHMPMAYGKLEQLRLEVAAHVIVLPTGEELKITFSGGLADSRADGSDVQTLLNAADQRMLDAKRSGRNRVVATAPVSTQSGAWRVVVTPEAR